MDTILVQVDDIAARKWRYASEKRKGELNAAISNLLLKTVDKNDEDFWALIERIGKEAEANGLTEEILNKILNEE